MSYPTVPAAGTQLPSADLQDLVLNPVYTYGESITAGDALYLKASDGKVYKADADVLANVVAFVGLATATGVANDTKPIYAIGKIAVGLSGLTAGTTYYLSNTAGGLSSTEGTFSLPIGVAVSTTALLITCSPQDIARIMAMQNIGSGTCGEAITAGQAVYIKASDSKLYKCDADADESTYSFVGVAQSTTAGTGETLYFAKIGGIAKGLSSRTVGASQFISSTAGQIDETPSAARYARIGIAMSTTTIMVISPKFIKKGTTTITGTGSTTITTGFYPAVVRVRAGFSQGARFNGFSVGDDQNCCVLDTASIAGTQSYSSSDAWRVINDLGTVNSRGTIDTKTQTGFNFNCAVYNTVNTILQWEVEN